MSCSKILPLLVAAGVGFGYGYWSESHDLGELRSALSLHRDPAWLSDLDPRYQSLVDGLKHKGFRIDENAAVCHKEDVVGFYTWGEPTIKVCSDRIARLRRAAPAFRILLQQTIAHEATHVAQSCRQRGEGKAGLGLSASRLYALPSSVQSDIDKSLTLTEYSNPRSVQWRIEAEAMAMEDTPDQVLEALHQFCR